MILINKTNLHPDLRLINSKIAWKELKLGEFVNISSEKRNIRNEHKIQYSIEMDDIESSTGRLLSKTKTDELKGVRNYFNKNQVLFAKLRPYLQKYYYSEQEGVCSTEFWVFDGSSEINNLYLYYLVQTPKFIQTANVSSGTKMPRADWSYMKNVSYYIPPLVEQKKIGEFLSVVDHLINLKEKEIKKMNELKKAYMQQIFNQDLRFQNINGESYSDWKSLKLGEIATLQGGYGFKSSKYQESGVPIIRISNLTEKININKNIIYYPETNVERDHLVHYNDLLIAMSGATTGKTGIYKEQQVAYLNQRVGKFVSNSKKLYYNFLHHLVKTENFKNELNTKLITGAQPNISSSDIESLNIKIPSCYDEQKKIADFLTIMDKKIELKNQELEKIKKYKKAFLEKMFV